jgi:hypothetical protein
VAAAAAAVAAVGGAHVDDDHIDDEYDAADDLLAEMEEAVAAEGGAAEEGTVASFAVHLKLHPFTAGFNCRAHMLRQREEWLEELRTVDRSNYVRLRSAGSAEDHVRGLSYEPRLGADDSGVGGPGGVGGDDGDDGDENGDENGDNDADGDENHGDDGDGNAAAAASLPAPPGAPRAFWGRTSISAGIEHAMAALERDLAARGIEAARRVIDVCGDGTNNSGREVGTVRDEAVAAGITVNALVIHSDPANAWIAAHVNPPGGLTHWFRENVMGGMGAFVLEVEDFDSFGHGITRKLINEIAGRGRPGIRFALLPAR